MLTVADMFSLFSPDLGSGPIKLLAFGGAGLIQWRREEALP